MSRTLGLQGRISARHPLEVLDITLRQGTLREGNPPAPSWLASAIAVVGIAGQVGLAWDLYFHWKLPIDTFWTPPHDVIYGSGFVGVALIGLIALRGLVDGYPLRRCVPSGYELAIVGVILFPIGGVADFIWHAVLGFERVLPVWSPSHLLIFFAAALILSSPLRHAWRSPATRLRYDEVVATAMFLLQITFPLVYTSPFLDIWASPPAQTGNTGTFLQELGTTSILLQAAMTVGFVLLLLSRFRLPFGTVTLFLVSEALFVYSVKWQVVPIVVGLVAGLIGDYLIYLLQPSPRRPFQFRVFAILFPIGLYATYFVALILTTGVWWLPHVWTGMLPGTAFVGWMLSYLLAPPRSGLSRAAASAAGSVDEGAGDGTSQRVVVRR